MQSPGFRETDGRAQEPWNAPISPAGRKMRGRSTALRMLRSNDENRAPNENKDSSNFANSAPAKLLSNAKSDRDSAEYKDRMSASAGSSHTEHSLTSNDGLSRTTSFASSGGSRTVNCLPPLPEMASSGMLPHLKQSQCVLDFTFYCNFLSFPFSLNVPLSFSK